MATTVTTPPLAPAGGQRDAERPAPTRGLARLGGEILAGVLVAAVVSLALQWLIARVRLPYPSHAPLALLALCCVVLLAVAVPLASLRRWPRWATPLTWAGLSALTTIPIALMLNGTRYYLGGIEIDQAFRTQYLTRLTDSAALADMTYQDVPPFYPAGWFWLGGRFANLLGLPGWAAFKPWAMVTLAVAAVLSFALWSVLVRRQVALLLAVVTALLGLHPDGASEPYSWLVAALLPPLAVIAWRMLRETHRPAQGPVVVLGIALGLCGAVYTLLCGFLGVLLVVLAVINIIVSVRRREASPGPLLRRTMGRAAPIALLALGPILLVWAPYLLALASGNPTTDTAARFLPAASATLPTPMLDVTVSGVLCLIGLAWIVLAAKRDPIAAALGLLTATCYLWYGLSTLALFADTTLLAFRIRPVLQAALTCGGVLGAIDLARWTTRRVGAATVRTPALIAAFVALLALAQGVPVQHRDAVEVAMRDPYPSGGNGSGVVDPANTDNWVPQVDDAIGRLTGKRPEELVLLVNNPVLLGGRPYWSYLSAIKQYGNPLIDYEARQAAVGRWAAARTPEQLIAELDRSPGATPTVFVLLRDDDGSNTAHVVLCRDTFPTDPNGHLYPVTFTLAAFDSPRFARADVGPFAVRVRVS